VGRPSVPVKACGQPSVERTLRRLAEMPRSILCRLFKNIYAGAHAVGQRRQSRLRIAGRSLRLRPQRVHQHATAQRGHRRHHDPRRRIGAWPRRRALHDLPDYPRPDGLISSGWATGSRRRNAPHTYGQRVDRRLRQPYLAVQPQAIFCGVLLPGQHWSDDWDTEHTLETISPGQRQQCRFKIRSSR